MLILTVIVFAAAGSLLPLSPIEPLLIALPTMASAERLVPIALLAAAAHMVGKVALYLGCERLVRVIPPARVAQLDRARSRLAGRPAIQMLSLFTSALVGIPSFYAATVVAGALKMPIRSFAAIGFLGRSGRFMALVSLPHLFTRIF
jgi:membrane protein YqaA with SNARE-associated domain